MTDDVFTAGEQVVTDLDADIRRALIKLNAFLVYVDELRAEQRGDAARHLD